jgi:hypothetical protein
MEREVHGQSPSVIFLDRAEMHIDIPAIPAPAGMPAPTPNTGEAYIRQSDGTPKLKRSLNFTPSIESDAGRESITMVRSTNPKYVTDQVWEELHVWVHYWILHRIPEDRKKINPWWKTFKREQTPCICFSIRFSDSQHAIPNSVLQGCESEDEDPTIGDGSVQFDGAPMGTGSIYQYEMFDTIQDADRHQIESPKRSTKNSTQGRLPHSNNGSTIEFLRSQSLLYMVTGAAHRPYGGKQPRSKRGVAAIHGDECAAEEGAKGAACGPFISGEKGTRW